ncbi:hypothetical protein SAY87_018882 [Trapa incisa]|uniref:Uncharacterized protein n=1 Tax=Trapa incisa TaxID=236973 RepID=A0AAN7K2R3_9MYRT|nr:hypothetical protein SAY87_018882 [Trapa incisa]
MKRMNKNSSMKILPVLLLCLLLLPNAVQGIRLGQRLSTLIGHHKIQQVEVTPIREADKRGEAHSACRGDGCTVSAMKKRVSGPSRKSSKDWLPSIQEDYYGPRHHIPRHHKH